MQHAATQFWTWNQFAVVTLAVAFGGAVAWIAGAAALQIERRNYWEERYRRMSMDRSLTECFPYWTKVTVRDALDIARVMITSEQIDMDGVTPFAGSSFAVIADTDEPGGRIVWLSKVSRSRLAAAWPGSTLRWYNSLGARRMNADPAA